MPLKPKYKFSEYKPTTPKQKQGPLALEKQVFTEYKEPKQQIKVGTGAIQPIMKETSPIASPVPEKLLEQAKSNPVVQQKIASGETVKTSSQKLREKQDAQMKLRTAYKISDEQIQEIADEVREMAGDKIPARKSDERLALRHIEMHEEKGNTRFDKYKNTDTSVRGTAKQALKTGYTESRQANERYKAGEQGLLETATQGGAAGASAGINALMSPLNPVINKIGQGLNYVNEQTIGQAKSAGISVGKGIRDIIGKSPLQQEQEENLKQMEISPFKVAGDGLGKIAEEYDKLSPRAKANLKVLEVGADLLPIPPASKVAKGLYKGTKPVVKQVAKDVATTASKVATKASKVKVPSVAEGVEKIKDAVTPESFSKISKKIKQNKMEDLIGISEAQKESLQSNPYIKEYGEKIIKRVDEKGTPADIKDVAREYLEEQTKRVEKKILEYEKRADSAGKNYQSLYNNIKENYNTEDLAKEIKKLLPEGKTIDQFIKDVDPEGYAEMGDLMKGSMSAKQLHQLRKRIDKLKMSPSVLGYDAKYQRIKEIRKIIDNKLKENPIRRKNDEVYSKAINEYEEFVEGLVYKDKNRKGEFRDNIVQIINTINNPNRSKIASRIADDLPDLVERIDAIEAMPGVVKNYIKAPAPNSLTTIMGALAGGTAGTIVPGLGNAVGLVVGGMLGKKVSSIFRASNSLKKQKLLKQIISNVSDEGKEKLAMHTKKLQEAGLSKEAKENIIKDIQRDIKNNSIKPALPYIKEVFEVGAKGPKRKMGGKTVEPISPTRKTTGAKRKVVETSSPNRVDRTKKPTIKREKQVPVVKKTPKKDTTKPKDNMTPKTKGTNKINKDENVIKAKEADDLATKKLNDLRSVNNSRDLTFSKKSKDILNKYGVSKKNLESEIAKQRKVVWKTMDDYNNARKAAYKQSVKSNNKPTPKKPTPAKKNQQTIKKDSEDLVIPPYLRLYKTEINKLNKASKNKEIVKIVDGLGREGQNEVFYDYPNLKTKYNDAKKAISINKIPMNRAETGQPIKETLYHGTNSSFDKIDPSFSDKSSGTGVGKGHVFYTDDKDVAKSYGRNIKETKIKLENPLVIDAKGSNWHDIKYKGDSRNINDIAKIAEKEGYDGLIVKSVRDTGLFSDKPAGFTESTTVAVFNKPTPKKPTPAKSKSPTPKKPTPAKTKQPVVKKEKISNNDGVDKLKEYSKKYESADEFVDDVGYRQDEFLEPNIDWDKETKKKFKYKINCVDCKEEGAIGRMVESSLDQEITYNEFIEVIPEKEIRKLLKIEKGDLDNYANKWYRSIYEGEPAYYIQNSGIERVFTNKNKLELDELSETQLRKIREEGNKKKIVPAKKKQPVVKKNNDSMDKLKEDTETIMKNYKKLDNSGDQEEFFEKIKKKSTGVDKKYLELFNVNILDELSYDLGDPGQDVLKNAKKLGLSIQETHAIHYGYTNTNFDYYADINKTLRDGGVLGEYDKVVHDMVIKALDKLETHKGVSYRGINGGEGQKIIEKMKKGDILDDKGFTSTSKSRDEAENFSLRGGLMLKIKGKSGKDIAPISYVEEEKEVLFKPGTQFKLDRIDTNGDYLFEEI